MKKRKVSVVLAALTLAIPFLLCSCSDYVGKEKSHPLFVKAGTSKSAGNFQEAAKCYEEFLLICPRSIVTCKELADLYNDSLNEPLKAVYYYEKWLSMLPEDTQEINEIRAFAENARKNLYKKLSVFYKEDPSLNPDQDAVKRLKEQLAAHAELNRKVMERNRMLVEIIEKLNAERRQINAARQAAPEKKETVSKRNSYPAAVSGVKPGNPKAEQSVPRKDKNTSVTTYTVQRGDTLSRISRKFYGSANHVGLILSANAGKIGRNMNIRAGQVLLIPPKSGKRR